MLPPGSGFICCILARIRAVLCHVLVGAIERLAGFVEQVQRVDRVFRKIGAEPELRDDRPLQVVISVDAHAIDDDDVIGFALRLKQPIAAVANHVTDMEISQPAMSQHLSVLRSAKLVREERQGRFVNYEVDPDGLALIAQWLAKYRAYWPARIEALKVLLKDMDQ